VVLKRRFRFCFVFLGERLKTGRVIIFYFIFILKILNFFILINIFLVFLNYFNVLILKIIF
jgi:hypothetical protein